MINETSELTSQYSDTYVGLVQPDRTQVPFLINYFTGPASGPTHATGAGPKETLTVPIERLDFRFPQLGMINGDNGLAWYVTRRPDSRQWKRGLRPRVLKAHTITPIPMIPGGDGFFSYPSVLFMYNPKYPSFREAVEQLQRGDGLSVGVSQDFWVGIHPTLRGLRIGYRMWTVGVVEEGNKPRFFPSKAYLKELWEEQVNAGEY